MSLQISEVDHIYTWTICWGGEISRTEWPISGSWSPRHGTYVPGA